MVYDKLKQINSLVCDINTLSWEAISFISRFYGGEPPDKGSFQPQRVEMLMNYDTQSPENDPDHKDVTPVMHSVPHGPFCSLYHM